MLPKISQALIRALKPLSESIGSALERQNGSTLERQKHSKKSFNPFHSKDDSQSNTPKNPSNLGEPKKSAQSTLPTGHEPENYPLLIQLFAALQKTSKPLLEKLGLRAYQKGLLTQKKGGQSPRPGIIFDQES